MRRIIELIKNNNLFNQSFIVMGSSFFVNLLNYFFHVIVGRKVDIGSYGEIETLISLMGFVALPSLAFTMLATKFSSEYKATNDKRNNYLLFDYLNKKLFIYGLPAMIMFFLFTPLMARFFNIHSYWPFYWVWVAVFMSFLYSITSGVLNGWQKFIITGTFGVLGTLIKLLIGILALYLGYNLGGIISAFALSAFLPYFLSRISLRKIIQPIAKEQQQSTLDFHPLKKSILPILLANLAIVIWGSVDMMIAKHNLDATSAGYYGALTILSKVIFFVSGAITTVIFSLSAENYHRNGRSLIIFFKGLGFMGIMISLMLVFYIFYPELILKFSFGVKYNVIVNQLKFFAFLAVIYSLVNYIISYLISIHQLKPMVIFLVLSIASSIGLFFYGKNIYNILIINLIGQSLAVLVGLIILFQHNFLSIFNYFRK